MKTPPYPQHLIPPYLTLSQSAVSLWHWKQAGPKEQNRRWTIESDGDRVTTHVTWDHPGANNVVLMSIRKTALTMEEAVHNALQEFGLWQQINYPGDAK